ncbi:hypothetical protein ACX3O0_02190 [Homoserinimonas sp. A447]
MTAFEIVSVIFGALGLLGGAIGFFRAARADRRSSAAEAMAADAQADAASALAKSADATERIAAAVELIARRRGVAADTLLTESSLPELSALLGRREVNWVVEARTVPNSYRLRNLGSLPAREVTIGERSAASLVEPGAATTFSTGQHPGAIEVSWRDDSVTNRLRSAVELPSEAEHGST